MQDEELLNTFLEESRENIQSARDAIDAIEGGEKKEDQLNAMYRAIHTIKGGSGMFHMELLDVLPPLNRKRF